MTENEKIIEEANEIAKGRMYATNEVIRLQKELEQYRAIGTVENFKRAKAMENVYGQVKWERDVAIIQLEEIGISLGQKMDEFKALKNTDIPIIHGKAELDLHDKEVRNKAIDDFAKSLKTDYVNFDLYYILQNNNFAFENTSLKFYQDMIDELAEQLKGEKQ